ncbi:MAG: SufD family Fe-S cluster assembly protein [Thermofilum sp.]
MRAVYLQLPYQIVRDSPTVKYYTDWTRFEKFLENPGEPTAGGFDARLLEKLGASPSILVGVRDRGVEPGLELADVKPIGLKLFQFHVENLTLARKTSVRGDAVILLEKPLQGVKSVHLELEVLRDSTLILASFSPSEAAGLLTVSLRTRVAPGVSADIVEVLVDSPGSSTALFHWASLDTGSRLRTLSLVVGGFADHVEESYTVRGENAGALIRGALAAPANSHVTFSTSTLQLAQRTKVLVKVVGFASKGTVVHKGLSTVERGSRGSAIRVESRLIPLTPDSRAYSAPMLEINSDEPAEASHSASHSPIDPEALFYLRSRGLSERDAVRTIVRGMLVNLVSGDGASEPRVKHFLEEVETALFQAG